MNKTIAELIDSLSITNIKIFMLVDKVQQNIHTKEDAFKLQKLNSFRNELINEINKYFDQREEIKI